MKVCVLFVVVSVMCHATSAIRKEPICSKFTFEEELLRKMVRLEFEMELMKKEMDSVKLTSIDRPPKSQIAFSAISPATLTPENKQIIIFKNVLLNEGSAYNPHTGVFTAPIDGLYHFTVHICNAVKQYAVVAIVHNGNIQAVSTQYENTGSGCGSISALIRINVGDNVNVISAYGTTRLLEDQYRRASFIGVRLA